MPSLLTARDAAKLLGVSERTAQRRAQEAARRGDEGVTRYGNYWAATEAWWREQLKRKPAGRPPKHRSAE
jgi:hypothetical protein